MSRLTHLILWLISSTAVAGRSLSLSEQEQFAARMRLILLSDKEALSKELAKRASMVVYKDNSVIGTSQSRTITAFNGPTINSNNSLNSRVIRPVILETQTVILGKRTNLQLSYFSPYDEYDALVDEGGGEILRVKGLVQNESFAYDGTGKVRTHVVEKYAIDTTAAVTLRHLTEVLTEIFDDKGGITRIADQKSYRVGNDDVNGVTILPHQTPQDLMEKFRPETNTAPIKQTSIQTMLLPNGTAKTIRIEKWYWPGAGVEISSTYPSTSSDKGIWTVRLHTEQGNWQEQTFYEGSAEDTSSIAHYQLGKWESRGTRVDLPNVSKAYPSMPSHQHTLTCSTTKGELSDLWPTNIYKLCHLYRTTFLWPRHALEQTSAYLSFKNRANNAVLSIKIFEGTSDYGGTMDSLDRYAGYISAETPHGDLLVVVLQPKLPEKDPNSLVYNIYVRTADNNEYLSIIEVTKNMIEAKPRIDYSLQSGRMLVNNGADKAALLWAVDGDVPTSLSLLELLGVPTDKEISLLSANSLSGPLPLKFLPGLASLPSLQSGSSKQSYSDLLKLKAADLQSHLDTRLTDLYSQQMEITQRFTAEIQDALDKNKLNAIIESNTKSPKSIFGKLSRKVIKDPTYDIGRMTDLSRGRINVSTFEEAVMIDRILRHHFAGRIDTGNSQNNLERFIKESSFTLDGYSRSHLILRDSAGNPFELQIGTQDLTKFIEARVGTTSLHDALYKGADFGLNLPEELQKEYAEILLQISKENLVGNSVSGNLELTNRIEKIKQRTLAALPKAYKEVRKGQGSPFLRLLSSPTAIRVGRIVGGILLVLSMRSLVSHIYEGKKLEATRDLSGVLVGLYAIGHGSKVIGAASKAASMLKWMGAVGGLLQMGVGVVELVSSEGDRISGLFDIAAGAGVLLGIWGSGVWWGPVGWVIAVVASAGHLIWNWQKENIVASVRPALDYRPVPIRRVTFSSAKDMLSGLTEVNQ